MIKLVCFDFDGVFTDGSFLVTSGGEVFKSFNAKDNHGLKLLKEQNIKVGIISANNSSWFNQLIKLPNFNELDFFEKGSKNKLITFGIWQSKLGISPSETAYMGDDVVDLECLSSAALSGCPKDAVSEVKKMCQFISTKKGGKGAVREFIDFILEENKKKKPFKKPMNN